MPERQSSTDEETGRPATGTVGTNGASAGASRDHPAGPPDGSPPPGTDDGSGAPAADGPGADGRGGAEDAAGSSAPTDGAGTDGIGAGHAAGPGSNGAAPGATAGSVEPDDAGTAAGTQVHGANGASPTGADRSAPPATTPVRDADPDAVGAAERTSLFDSAVPPAPGAGLHSSPPGTAADAATGTVVLPGRSTERVRSADADARPDPASRDAGTGGAPDPAQPGDRSATVRVPLPAAAAVEAATRPTPTPDGEAPTRAVPLPTRDAETTQVIPLSSAAPHRPTPPASIDAPTQRLPLPRSAPQGGPPGPPRGPVRVPAGPGGGRSRRRRPLLISAAVVALLGLLYLGDLLLTSGSVPRGTTVAGIDVGGRSLADAEQQLRAEIEPRAGRPVPVTAGAVTSEIDPVAAGLAVDWDGTLAQAGDQPLNPFTRIASFFTTGNALGVVTTADEQALSTAVQQLAPVVDTAPVEGTVRFEGATPVPVDPVPGQQLDAPAAIEVVKAEWVSGRPVALPLTTLPARTSAEDVATAVSDVATPAVSAPVTVLGEQDTQGVLEPETIAQALSFVPGPTGGLTPVLNPTVITDALTGQLEESEQPAVDAKLDTSTSPPTVVPSQDGRGVDYKATLATLLPVLAEDAPREVTAVYADQPAEVTTDELRALGDAGVISRFTTEGFAADSGINIRRAAALVDGTIVAPGETFSLDEVTGPRTAANGYVEAGVIDNGRPGRGIAGGVSQVATTTYNAAYFAGMTDVEHRPHSFYISRYPKGREATIVDGALDMQFRNDTPTAVLIRTNWTPANVTVTFYGTKYYEVTSSTSPDRDITEPNTVTVEDEPCTPSEGRPGFTVTDTRRIENLATGEVRTEEQTTKYNPAPRVVCEDD